MNKTYSRQSLLCLVLTLLFVASAFLSLFAVATNDAYAASSSSNDYYASLDTTLTGEAFRTQLANLITTTHKKQTSYDDLRNVFQKSDADPNNKGNILLFYTGTSVSFSGNFGSANVDREHVWPKNAGNAFPEKTECGSDAHHLRPCNKNINSTRSNYSFGEVAQTSSNLVKEDGSSNYGNSANGKDAMCYLSGGLFYPAKGYRGATARILMYVQTRWGNKFDLTFVDGAGKNKTIGDFDALYKWHLEEPPTDEEIRRNQVVYEIQGNRNPFIDHPEYAYYIYSEAGSYFSDKSLAKSVKELTKNNDAYNNLPEGGEQLPSTENVSWVSVDGTPTKTMYKAGEKFDPTGLSVTVTYTNGNVAEIDPTLCTWHDGKTKAETLSAGSASVFCRFGNCDSMELPGITVLNADGTVYQPSANNGCTGVVSSVGVLAFAAIALPIAVALRKKKEQ